MADGAIKPKHASLGTSESKSPEKTYRHFGSHDLQRLYGSD